MYFFNHSPPPWPRSQGDESELVLSSCFYTRVLFGQFGCQNCTWRSASTTQHLWDLLFISNPLRALCETLEGGLNLCSDFIFLQTNISDSKDAGFPNFTSHKTVYKEWNSRKWSSCIDLCHLNKSSNCSRTSKRGSCIERMHPWFKSCWLLGFFPLNDIMACYDICTNQVLQKSSITFWGPVYFKA